MHHHKRNYWCYMENNQRKIIGSLVCLGRTRCVLLICWNEHVQLNDNCFDSYFGVDFSGNLNKISEKLAKSVAAQIKSSGGHPSTVIASMMHKVRSKFANPLNPPFVAAFCQSNVGDTTPNTLGPYCLDSGLPCDFNHSTCNGMNELCVGRGPGYVYFYWNVFSEA